MSPIIPNIEALKIKYTFVYFFNMILINRDNISIKIKLNPVIIYFVFIKAGNKQQK